MESYWKVNDLAAVLQISVQTIYRYVANGEIPFHKLNRAVRFKPSEIESWIESKRPGATANGNENIADGLLAKTASGETEALDNICKIENDGSEA